MVADDTMTIPAAALIAVLVVASIHDGSARTRVHAARPGGSGGCLSPSLGGGLSGPRGGLTPLLTRAEKNVATASPTRTTFILWLLQFIGTIIPQTPTAESPIIAISFDPRAPPDRADPLLLAGLPHAPAPVLLGLCWVAVFNFFNNLSFCVMNLARWE